MRMRTIDGRRRTAAVLTGTAAAAGLMALAAATPAAAEEDPPPDDTSTTVPDTTIPPDTDATTPGSDDEPTSTSSTSVVTEPDRPTTTAPEATTTTLPPRPAETWPPDRRPTCQQTGWWPYMFVAEGPINAGDTFDDPDSDLVVTFSAIDWVEDHLRVTIEANYLDAITLASNVRWSTSMSVYVFDGRTTVTLDLPSGLGDTIDYAEFCFRDPSMINAEPNVPSPASPTTVTSAPQEAIGGTTAPLVTATVVVPPVPTTEGVADDGGTLPESGKDVLPLVLAGAGLAAVGGGLLLGRRMRRAGA